MTIPQLLQTILYGLFLILVAGPLLMVSGILVLRLVLPHLISFMVCGDPNYNRWTEYGSWREEKLSQVIQRIGLVRVPEDVALTALLVAMPERKNRPSIQSEERTFVTERAGHRVVLTDMGHGPKSAPSQEQAMIKLFGFLPFSWIYPITDSHRTTVAAVQIPGIGTKPWGIQTSGLGPMTLFGMEKISKDGAASIELRNFRKRFGLYSGDGSVPETLGPAFLKALKDFRIDYVLCVVAQDDWLLFFQGHYGRSKQLPAFLDDVEAFLDAMGPGKIPEALALRQKNRRSIGFSFLSHPTVIVFWFVMMLAYLGIQRDCLTHMEIDTQSAQWPSTQAFILQGHVTSKSTEDPGLQYRYSVDGRNYLSSATHASDPKGINYRDQNRILKDHLALTTIPVYFDPAHPDRAAVFTGATYDDQMMVLMSKWVMGLCGLLTLAGLASNVFLIFRRQRVRLENPELFEV